MSNLYDLCWDDTFKMSVEEEQGKLFIHCDVVKFSKETLSKIKECWSMAKTSLSEQGFDSIYSYTDNLQFCEVVDNSFTKLTSLDVDGKTLEVLKWELK